MNMHDISQHIASYLSIKTVRHDVFIVYYYSLIDFDYLLISSLSVSYNCYFNDIAFFPLHDGSIQQQLRDKCVDLHR